MWDWAEWLLEAIKVNEIVQIGVGATGAVAAILSIHLWEQRNAKRNLPGRGDQMGKAWNNIVFEDAMVHGIEEQVLRGRMTRSVANQWYAKLTKEYGLSGLYRMARDGDKLHQLQQKLLKKQIKKRLETHPQAKLPVEKKGEPIQGDKKTNVVQMKPRLFKKKGTVDIRQLATKQQLPF